MKRLRIVNLLLSLCLALTLAFPAVEAYAAASTVKISNYTSPTTVTFGSSFTLKGKITANMKIKRVEIGVVDSNNRWTAQKYDNSAVNATSFDIAKADPSIRFGKLAAGSYKYRIYAHTSDGQVHIVLNKAFTVKKAATTTTTVKSTAKISGYTAPSTVTLGSPFTLKGTVTSNMQIKRAVVGVTYTSNKWTAQKYINAAVNSKTFDVGKADPSIRFGKLYAGTYKYKVIVRTADDKYHTVLNKEFTVKKPATSTTAASTNMPATKKTTNVVKITGYNRPGDYRVGRKFNVKGTLTSTKKIRRVEIGIVLAATNKWTEYKYDKRWLSSKTFDISRAASTLKFDQLPGGTYRYRIYVHTTDGAQLVLNRKFTVTPSSKPRAAVNWAKRIAADNSFTYGAKPAANAVGCYFCGTNHGPVKYTKPKGYEKTYVCLTFIGAAYAHGAKDPEILSECKRGRMTMYETDSNFSRFSCWMKLGKCKELSVSDLQVGDVIIKWSNYNDNSGHVCMYIGNNNIVESSGGGWGANSIAVKYGVAASRLRSLSSDSRNYVMRYRR